MHLGLDLLFQQDLAALENLLDVRPQLARLRIDNRKLLFDTERVGVLFLHPSGRKTSADFADLHRLFLSSRNLCRFNLRKSAQSVDEQILTRARPTRALLLRL